MSKLQLIEDTSGKLEKGYIRDATFCYVKLQTGSYKYQSKTEKEYTVDVVVDKKTAKAFKKAFPKNGFKEVDTADFEKQFKIAPPFPDEDEQFIIKMKADCQLKYDAPNAGLVKGDKIPHEWSSRPKVLRPVEGGVEDITLVTLVANGSKGDVSFNIKSNDFGTFPAFTGILVKELIEYQGGNSNTTAFGEVVGGFNTDESNIQQDAESYERVDLDEDSPEGDDSSDDDTPF